MNDLDFVNTEELFPVTDIPQELIPTDEMMQKFRQNCKDLGLL